MNLTPYFAEKDGRPSKTIFQLIDENNNEVCRAAVAIMDNEKLQPKVFEKLNKIKIEDDDNFVLKSFVNGKRFSNKKERVVPDGEVREGLVYRIMKDVTHFFKQKEELVEQIT